MKTTAEMIEFCNTKNAAAWTDLGHAISKEDDQTPEAIIRRIRSCMIACDEANNPNRTEFFRDALVALASPLEAAVRGGSAKMLVAALKAAGISAELHSLGDRATVPGYGTLVPVELGDYGFTWMLCGQPKLQATGPCQIVEDLQELVDARSEVNAAIVKDLEKNVSRLLEGKADALKFNHYAEAERYHYKVAACRAAIEWLSEVDCNEAVITVALLDACRQLEADRPSAIACCKVFGEVLKTMRSFPNVTRLAII